MQEPARVLVVDWPWKFGDKLPGPGRGAEKHYPTIDHRRAAEVRLPPVADDSFMFFWRVAAMQREALDIARAWDFGDPVTELVWRKQTKTRKRWFGMGHTVRAEHEVCLIFKRGKPQVRHRSQRSVFDAIAEGHSTKPREFYAIVEALCDGPYVELFARCGRPGWTCYGNVVTPGVEPWNALGGTA